MLKEIIDIGRVSSNLASVFTFKGLSKYYAEIILKWDGKNFKFKPNNIQYVDDIEKYLHLGVHRGKKGSTLYFLPTSFIVTKTELKEFKEFKKDKKDKKDKNKLLKKFKDGLKAIESTYELKNEKVQKDFLSKLTNAIIENIDSILELAELGLLESNKDKNREIENIAVVIKIEDGSSIYYISQDKNIFQKFEQIEFSNIAKEMYDGSGKSKKQAIGMCNILNIQSELYYPNGSFYYPYSTDKVNVRYGLIDDKNLFLLSKQAFIYFMVGKTYLESFNEFYFMGMKSYITATTLNDEALQDFQGKVKKSKNDFDGFIQFARKMSKKENDILLNIYFFEPTKTGNNIIELVKDILPSRLSEIEELFGDLKYFFENQFDYSFSKLSWQYHIYQIYHKDGHKKFRTSLFRKIALNDAIVADRLMFIMNEKMQQDVGKNSYMLSKENYIFLTWIKKLTKGELEMSEEEEKPLFQGNSYEERLTNFLATANLVKDSSSMKMGVCLGLSLRILSWSINGYDKKVLAFVGKRIERNSLNSLQILVNEVIAKTKLHGYDGLQSVNVKLLTLEMINLNDSTFNKDEFIFGLFLGNGLYRNVKSQNDPKETEDENNEQGVSYENE